MIRLSVISLSILLFLGLNQELTAQHDSEVTLSEILNEALNPDKPEYVEPDRTGSNEEQIKAVIDQMFDGMRAGSAGMITPLFTNDAKLKSVSADQFGKIQISTPIAMRQFAEAVAKPRTEV